MLLSYVRTILLYLILVGVIRMMGKRQIGEMEASEFVVTMLVANLAAIPMQDGGIPLFSGLVPILTVLGAELVLSWGIMKSVVLRKLLCGKPVILIENGHILQSALQRTRVSFDELAGHLREKDVLDPRSVQYAILETNGTLSVFPYPKESPAPASAAGIAVPDQTMPVYLIQDGKVLWENLRLIGQDADWLTQTLGSHNARVENTFLLSKAGDEIVWVGKERG